MKIKILDLRHIPNTNGFKFTGIGYQGELYPDLEVKINEFGQFYVIGYNNLFGWIRINKIKKKQK